MRTISASSLLMSFDHLRIQIISCRYSCVRSMFQRFLHKINRGSYMGAHVLLNLLNKLGKRDKMRGLPSILSLFRNEFNKFNNTRA